MTFGVLLQAALGYAGGPALPQNARARAGITAFVTVRPPTPTSPPAAL